MVCLLVYNLNFLMFSFSFSRAKCLISARQLGAEIKALFRDVKVQMEGAPLSVLFVMLLLCASEGFELLNAAWVKLASWERAFV